VGRDLLAELIDRMSVDECLDRLLQIEGDRAVLAAEEARLLARMVARPDPVPAVKGFIREEIAAALRWSANLTGQRIEVAQALTGPLTATLDVLEDGALSYAQARALAAAVAPLDREATAEVQQRVLARAGGQSLARFSAALRRAVSAVDPRGAEQRHQACAGDRRVSVAADEEAMAWLHAYLPAVDAATIWTAVQAIADGVPAGDARSADQKCADALTSLAAGALARGELVEQHARRPAVQVTVALSTLLGVDEQPGDLDGHGPIPAALARRIAADPTGTWRRLVTDPRGRLIDYGRSRYRPPPALAEFVLARDRTCRGPITSRTARRCDIDHRQPWHDGGTTNQHNLQVLSKRAHIGKDQIGWHSRLLSDGTTRWTSPLARVYDKPPDPYPTDTTVRTTSSQRQPEHDPDPPPF
jgi:Domain of unknown function (DUF222)